MTTNGTGDTHVRIWDVEIGKLKHSLEGHLGEIRSLVELKHSKYLASGSMDSTIRIWDPIAGRLVFTLEKDGAENDPVACLTSIDDPVHSLASGSNDGTILIWDLREGKLGFKFDKTNGGHSSFISALVYLEQWRI